MAGSAIVIDGEGESFSAYAPELPGCIATGESVAKIDGNPIPLPTTVATAVAEVALRP
jgi:hypothetical protein